MRPCSVPACPVAPHRTCAPVSAVLQSPEPQLRPITTSCLPAVLAVEQRAYSHPWTDGNFRDALRVGYEAQALWAGDELLGYYIAMRGVDEVHLLNLTVSPDHQGRGLGRLLLEALAAWSCAQGIGWLWLEVRASNSRALRLYEARGFRRVGLRRGYYPLNHQRREDAVVMSLQL